jgi:molybdopterin/thiamine biosynthesis adenylyltransferase
MKDSKVLVINLTGAVTELIRHLVLSGINLEIVNDGKIVEAHHADEDFLIDAETDQGKYVFLIFFFFNYFRQVLLSRRNFQK